jgi:UDP-2-acetamido-2,6-beta-L-arabino-hexul-4-ose reductase
VVHVAITGGNGFLGWHTRAALLESGTATRTIRLGHAFDRDQAELAVNGAERLIHIAGVNRGTDDEVRDGNLLLARQTAEALRVASVPPATVTFANSTQSLVGGLYGDAKAEASDIVRAAAREVGATYEDVVLPNLFGEHGRPFYNAVTSTFAHRISQGEVPTVENDKELTLLHVQDAADLLTGGTPAESLSRLATVATVSEILAKLLDIAETYRRGEIPDVLLKFDRDLFNTYRSYVFPDQAPVRLARHADARGSFFEIIRSHGGPGQSSFSTTEPGISRGDHFHRRKIERFTVLSGKATIALRKVFSDEVIEFDVTGTEPVAVDMPTMWAHKITNTGPDTLFTSFWTNDIFNPDFPDTIPEAVNA